MTAVHYRAVQERGQPQMVGDIRRCAGFLGQRQELPHLGAVHDGIAVEEALLEDRYEGYEQE